MAKTQPAVKAQGPRPQDQQQKEPKERRRSEGHHRSTAPEEKSKGHERKQTEAHRQPVSTKGSAPDTREGVVKAKGKPASSKNAHVKHTAPPVAVTVASSVETVTTICADTQEEDSPSKGKSTERNEEPAGAVQNVS